MGLSRILNFFLYTLLLYNFSNCENIYRSLLKESFSLSSDKYKIDNDNLVFLTNTFPQASKESSITALYNVLFTSDSEQCQEDANYTVQSYNNYTYLTNGGGCKKFDCDCKQNAAMQLKQYDWIAMLLDSFGTKGSYLKEGNIYWLGGYHECLQTTSEPANSAAKFNGKYCTLSAIVLPKLTAELPDPCINETTNHTFIPLKYGICIPDSCFVNKIGEHRMSINITSTLEIEFNITCHEKLDVSQDARAISVICLFSFFGLLLLIATVYDLILRDVSSEKKRNNLSLPVKMLLCFSVLTNTQKMFSTEAVDGQLNCIHGIRFISMSWVILGHTYFLAIISIDNIVTLFDIRSEFTEQIIMNGTFSVDTFFVLSGTLLCFLWLKETKKQDGNNITSISHWILYYAMRFIRLTPPYMLVMGFDIAVFRYLADGPLWNQLGFEKNFCQDTWWTNLIYLNNFINPANMCMAWTWYLANDMQFHWICPIILILLWKLPKVGISLSALLVVVSSVTTGVISYINNYPPNQINFNKNSSQFSSDATGYFDGVYMKPYTRAGPFFLGVILGYILYKAQGKKLRLSTPFNATCWLIATGLSLSVAYGLYGVANGNIMNKFVSAFYSAVARSVWGLGVCWLIFACVTNNGGFVNRFLSWKVFIPLSRMTYCAYLIHPLVLLVAYTGRQTAIHFDSDFTMIYYYLPNMAIAYGLAFVATLAFESPVINLQKLIFTSRNKKSEFKSTTEPNILVNGDSHYHQHITVEEINPEYLNVDKNGVNENSHNHSVIVAKEKPEHVDTEKNWEASIRQLGKPIRPQLININYD